MIAAMRAWAVAFGLLVLLMLFSACGGGGGEPLPTSGIWRATQTSDPIMGVAQTPDTTHLYEFNFAGAGVTGWHYACNAGWINCAPGGRGLALTGTLAKGAGDFTFTYAPAFGVTIKVRITGTFSTGGFVGRFERTAVTGTYTPVKGDVTMVWIQSQR